MLGAIIGDIVGSAYEFNNIKTTDFQLFTPRNKYTDDSIMTVAVANWLLMDPSHGMDTLEASMVNFAQKHPSPMGGYGGLFLRWLFGTEGKREPYNSWGNGSAMRVSAVGWAFDTLQETEHVANLSATITHNHPEGIKGAQATAATIFMARNGSNKDEIKEYILNRYGYDLNRTCDEIRPTYGWESSCQGTVPEAIVAFLDSTDFESAIRLAVSLGGDSDTLACITGGIAEAYYKDIPEHIYQEVWYFLPKDLKEVLKEFGKRFIAPYIYCGYAD